MCPIIALYEGPGTIERDWFGLGVGVRSVRLKVEDHGFAVCGFKGVVLELELEEIERNDGKETSRGLRRRIENQLWIYRGSTSTVFWKDEELLEVLARFIILMSIPPLQALHNASKQA